MIHCLRINSENKHGKYKAEAEEELLHASHSPPYSDEVMNAWSCTSTSLYVSMVWCLVTHRVVFMKHRDNFALPLLSYLYSFVRFTDYTPSDPAQYRINF
jgi:hypothetical protein